MPTMRGAGRAMMTGFGIALTFAVVNGLSTHILKDGATLDDWVTSRVSA